jgi:geranylgeranyl diphosphate synthase type I
MNDTTYAVHLTRHPVRHDALREEQALAIVESLMHDLAASSHGVDRTGNMVGEHLAAGGKRLRARLALAASAALGGSMESAIPWAAACEVLHNASLVHDDVQDGDRVRRGQPTTWVIHGVAQAINVGDLMLMMPFLCLERLNTDNGTRWLLSRLLARAAAETVRGQSAEMDLLPRRRLAVSDYISVIEGKTAALFGMPVQGAALLAGLSEQQADQLAMPFRLLGQLFQLQDDVLDLYGEKGRDCSGSDLREGKVSALVVEHIVRRPNDISRLLTLLETPRESTSDAEVAWAIDAFARSGALLAVLDRIDGLASSIRANRALEAWPQLRQTASMLVTRCLQPIQHLTPPTSGVHEERSAHV